MANKKIQATATLFLDTKDAQNDAKKFVNDLKRKLSEIETAADKMSVFKDMVAYIAQVDRALTALKKNNRNAFNNMFDGLDVNLKKQLEGLFSVDSGKLGKLDVLRDKLSTLSADSSINEIKDFAKEINDIFDSIGLSVPFKNIDEEFKKFSKQAKTEHLQKLSNELANFAIIWKNVNSNIANGFSFGSGGPGLGSEGALSEIEALIKNIEKKNEELLAAKERFDKILAEFNNANKNGISDSYKIDLTEESVKGLTLEYDRLQTELESADASSHGFYNTLTRLIEISLKLKKAFSDISADDGLKQVFQNASAGTGTGEATLYGLLSRYARSKDPVNKDIQKIIGRGDLQNTVNSNNALVEELRTSNDINVVIQKRIDLYNKLKAKLHEYNTEQNKEFDTDEDEDESFKKLERMEKEVASLTGATKRLSDVQNVLADLSEDGAVLDDVLQKLYKTLGMETPDVFKERLNNMVAEARAAIAAIDDIGGAETGAQKGSVAGSSRGTGSGSGSGAGGTVTAEVDFTSLESTIKAEASSIANKLDGNTFKVEVVKDHTEKIQSAIGDVLSAVQKISEHYNVDKNKTDVDNMKQNLLQLLDVVNTHNAGRTSGGDYQRQELGIALLSDGSFSVNYGDKGSVSWDHMAESLIANLNKTLLGDIHSHPLHELLKNNDQTFVSDALSGAHGDLGASRFAQHLGAQIAGMITGNVLRVLDLSSVTPDMMAKMQKELYNIEQRYADSGMYSKYIGKDKDGRFGAKVQTTLEDQHQVTKLAESMMYEAFQKVGYSKDYIDNAIFKKYNLTDDAQLTDLATRLVQLVSSAGQAVPPMERLAEVITKFGGDTTSVKAKTLFEAYDKGELKASEVFNNLVPDNRVNESAIQSLLNINNAKQMSPIESLLNNISSILSNINTAIGNIEASTKLNGEEQLDLAIRDLLDLKAGLNNDSLNKGIESIYNSQDPTKYRYDDVEGRAIAAINDFVDDLKLKSESDGLSFSESATKDALELVNKFKTAFAYLQDFGKQTDLFAGGRNDLGLYVDPSSGKILDTYDAASEMLINSDVLDALINQLKSIKDKEYDSDEARGTQQLQVSIENLSVIVSNLSSIMSSFNGMPLEQKLPKTYNIFDDDASSEPIDVSQDIANLDVFINKVREAAGEIRGLATEVSGIIENISNPFKGSQDIAMSTTDDEFAQLEKLKSQLLEVKAAVDAKTQAFEEEYVTVDAVVDAEVASLQSLVNQLTQVITQINLINDGFNNFNTNIPDIQLGNKSTENIHYVTDPQGNPVTMYRGIRNSYSGLVSNRYHGGTFSTDNLELAKEYAGELGKVEKVLLSMKNPLEIEGNGAYWNQIEYIGSNADEASQKLFQLNSTIRQTEAILKELKNTEPTEKELRDLSRGFIIETRKDREIREYTEQLKAAKAERDAIFADPSNPYGKKNTNEIVEIAKANGYDGVIFKNIIDSATGKISDMSNVMVTFGQEQIHYIETIKSTLDDVMKVDSEATEVETKVDVDTEIEQLNRLQSVLVEVKNAIVSKTKAFVDEGNIVGQVVGKEIAALNNLSGIVDGIIPKINNLVQNLNNIDTAKLSTVTTDVDVSGNVNGQDASPKDPFKAKLFAQTGAFTKYRNSIQNVDYLTEDLEKQLDSLGVSLKEVTNQSGLDAWVKRFNNLKENIQTVRSEFEQMNLGKVNLFQRELTNSFNKLTLPQREDMLQEYLLFEVVLIY